MPKVLGAVRTLDDLNRIVIPREMVRVLDWHPRDPIEVLLDGKTVVFKKYEDNKDIEKAMLLLELNKIVGDLDSKQADVVDKAINYLKHL